MLKASITHFRTEWQNFKSEKTQVTVIKLSLVAADNTALSRNHSVDCVVPFFSGLLEAEFRTKKGSSSESQRTLHAVRVIPTILWLNLVGDAVGEKTGNYHPMKVNIAIQSVLPLRRRGTRAKPPRSLLTLLSVSVTQKAGFQRSR